METNQSCGPKLLIVVLQVCLIPGMLAGCSESGTPTAPVSGKVTLNGQPLANVSVLFQPAGGANRDPGVGSYGITDDQGRFTLKLSGTNKPGAVVGQHVVTIVEKGDPANDQDAGGTDKPEVSRIPAEFSDGTKKFEVQSDTPNQANFELKSPTS